MTLPPPNVCQRIRALHALIGSPYANEAEVARNKLSALLAEHDLTWNDLPTILTIDDNIATTSTTAPHASAAPAAPEVNVLDLVSALIEKHVAVTAEERMAVALWTLHTYVFNRFTHTPRLALLSPAGGCGKSTLLIMLEALTAGPYRSDNVTAAAVYYELDERPSTTLLLDEGDNLGLLNNHALRAVFNSGYRRGASITRCVSGRSQKFSLFAPLAVAAIGALPLPLMYRSVIINMQRHAPGETRLEELNEADPALASVFAAARDQIRKWAATCALGRNPEMPPSLHNRAADNWRVLLAIADDLGHGTDARATAVALCSNRQDEDFGVVVLADIKTVFLARGVDRIASAALVEALLALEDGHWNEWRGRRDDGPPRKLTQGEMALLLKPFGVRPRTIWPLGRRPSDRSARGYLRSQFEKAWAAYCPSADTPTQPKEIKQFAHR